MYSTMRERLISEGQTEIYVTSFTEMPDQLSQWRAYCQPHGGYSIGLRAKRLAGPRDGCWLVRCLYDRERQENLVASIIDTVMENAERDRQLGGSRDIVYREAYKLFGKLIPFVATALKDEGFAEEKEWRLVHRAEFFNDMMCFRSVQSTIIPYYEHFFSEDHKELPIEEVVLGPTPHTKLASEALESLLSTRGVRSVKVRSSAIPYRAW